MNNKSDSKTRKPAPAPMPARAPKSLTGITRDEMLAIARGDGGGDALSGLLKLLEHSLIFEAEKAWNTRQKGK